MNDKTSRPIADRHDFETPREPERSGVNDAAAAILTMLHLYPNYRVDSRGPSGLCLDALDALRPDLAERLRNLEDPGALCRELEAEPCPPPPACPVCGNEERRADGALLCECPDPDVIRRLIVDGQKAGARDEAEIRRLGRALENVAMLARMAIVYKSRGGAADWRAVHKLCGEAWPAARSSPLRETEDVAPEGRLGEGEPEPWRYDPPPTDEWILCWVREASGGEYWTPGLLHDGWRFTYEEGPLPDITVLAWQPGPKGPGTAIVELGEIPEPKFVARWTHFCNALPQPDIELWVARCPHCGRPAPAPSPEVEQGGPDARAMAEWWRWREHLAGFLNPSMPWRPEDFAREVRLSLAAALKTPEAFEGGEP